MIGAATADPETCTRSTGLWDYVSPTRLNTWLRCPLAFKLRYVDQVRAATSPKLFLGKVVHSLLEGFYRHRQFGIDLSASDVVDRLDWSWDELVQEDEMTFVRDEEEELKRQAVDLVRTYLRFMPADEPKPVAVETTVEVPLIDPSTREDLGIPLLGVVDLILPSDDGQTIVDFKTAAKSNSTPEVAHEIQLSSYAYAVRQMTGHEEAGMEIRSLIKTRLPKLEVMPFERRTDQHFRRLFAVIRAYLDDLDCGRFIYRPSWTCSMCEFRESHCRQWQL